MSASPEEPREDGERRLVILHYEQAQRSIQHGRLWITVSHCRRCVYGRGRRRRRILTDAGGSPRQGRRRGVLRSRARSREAETQAAEAMLKS
jgi:hypothetical protein